MACGRLANESLMRREAMLPLSQTEHPSLFGSHRDQKHELTLDMLKDMAASDMVLFLQREHETILRGLYKQIEELQQKCHDLQFELHLKHAKSDLTYSNKQLANRLLHHEEKSSNEEVKEQNEGDNHKPNPLTKMQLLQRVDEVQRKDVNLGNSVSLVSSQLQQTRRSNTPVKPKSSNLRSLSMSQNMCTQKRLDSFEKLRLAALDEESVTKNESRLSRIHSSPPLLPSRKHDPLLPPSQNFLPPINPSRKTKRPHVRKQLRLFSAPISNNSNLNNSKKDL